MLLTITFLRLDFKISAMRFYLLLAVMIVTVIPFQGVRAQLKMLKNGTVLIDNFQSDTVGSLPVGWYNRDGNKKPWLFDNPEQRDVYKWQIKESADGNKYLQYDGSVAMHLNFPTVHEKQINLEKTPILTWKWRVYKIPKGGDENDNNKNDVAASIYVVYSVNFLKMPKSIRYTWSSTLPVGTILSKYFNRQKIVVLASGAKNEGKWITFQRNIAQDYENLFGSKPPKRPIAILILSDGDNTKSQVIADYDDIELRPVNTTRRDK